MDSYAQFRTVAGCGWATGTAFTGPRICGRTAKFTTDAPSAVNGRVCGIHRRTASGWGHTTAPISKEN